MAHYCGLYYPFIHFKDDAWLKLTALYWDKMGRIVPETYQTEDTDTVKQLAEQSDYIETFPPSWVGPEFGEKFVQFLKTHAEVLRMGYGLSQLHEWPNLPRNLMPPPQGGSSGTDSRLSYVFNEKMTLETQRELQNLSLATPDPMDPRWVGMHPKLATIYMTALTEELAAKHGLRPVTDETLDHLAVSGCTIERLGQALLRGLELTTSKPSAEEVSVEMANVAFRAVIPKNIANIPTERIIRFRKRFAAERTGFQEYLEALASKAEWREIQDVRALESHLKLEYTKHIKPKLDDLKKQFGDVGIDTVYGAMNVRVAAAPAAALAAIDRGADLVLAGTAGAVGLGVGLLSVIREKRKELEKQYSSSPAAYLLRLEEDLAPATLLSWIQHGARKFCFGM